MTHQLSSKWMAAVTFSVGVVFGAGAMLWTPQPTTVQMTQTDPAPRYEQHFARLEQAVMALGQLLAKKDSADMKPQPTCASAKSTEGISQEALSKTIRQELHQALAKWSPADPQLHAQEIANAQLRNTPENKAAYHSASTVVRTAIAAKRWTDEDGEAFRIAMGQLTREQHEELMQLLIPAINNGEVKVEGNGPLF